MIIFRFFQFMALAFITSLWFTSAEAGTCSSISRTNFSANSVLTSSELNSQFNAVYNAANDLDGGCITDGTIEDGALNTTDFAAILNGIQQGCKVVYSSASAVTIDRCIASVNGNFVRTTSATTVNMGCGDCSSETATTDYYVYIKTGSSGSSLTGYFSTTSPNNDGYDSSGNKVLARLRNDDSSDIDQYSIDQWLINTFSPSGGDYVTYSPSLVGFGATANLDFKWRRDESELVVEASFDCGTPSGIEAQIPLPNSYRISSGAMSIVGEFGRDIPAGGTEKGGFILATEDDTFVNLSDRGVYSNTSKDPIDAADGNRTCATGETLKVSFRVQVEGWKGQ